MDESVIVRSRRVVAVAARRYRIALHVRLPAKTSTLQAVNNVGNLKQRTLTRAALVRVTRLRRIPVTRRDSNIAAKTRPVHVANSILLRKPVRTSERVEISTVPKSITTPPTLA